MEEEFKEYYLATEEGRENVIYKSERFRLNELDIINLIKICLVQKRAVSLGKKILEVYKDSTQHKKEEAIKTLKKLGIEEDEEKPTRTKNGKNK